jgi:hypothetical protein
MRQAVKWYMPEFSSLQCHFPYNLNISLLLALNPSLQTRIESSEASVPLYFLQQAGPDCPSKNMPFLINKHHSVNFNTIVIRFPPLLHNCICISFLFATKLRFYQFIRSPWPVLLFYMSMMITFLVSPYAPRNWNCYGCYPERPTPMGCRFGKFRPK